MSSNFNAISSVAALNASFSAGDPFCPTHGMGPCVCGTVVDLTWADTTSGGSIGVLPGAIGTGGTISVSTYTCPMCSSVVLQGVYHVCIGSVPGSVPVPFVPYTPNVFPSITIPIPECALCDKYLEPDDKKVCKECRGVFEAWKFLTKPDEPEPEPEPEK